MGCLYCLQEATGATLQVLVVAAEVLNCLVSLEAERLTLKAEPLSQKGIHSETKEV